MITVEATSILKLTELAPTLRTVTARQVADYQLYIERTRGLVASTIAMHASTVTKFLRFLDYDSRPQQLRDLRADEVGAFVEKVGGEVGRGRMVNVTAILRTFLRFLAATGKGPAGLDAQVESPRIYRGERLPRALPWDTVRTFLRSIDRTTPKGRRDYVRLSTTYQSENVDTGIRASGGRGSLDDGSLTGSGLVGVRDLIWSWRRCSRATKQAVVEV